jgi:hypothetical protein
MTTQLRSQESEPVQSLRDYVTMFHRRRTLVVLTGGVLLGLSLAAAFLWPATQIHGDHSNRRAGNSVRTVIDDY